MPVSLLQKMRTIGERLAFSICVLCCFLLGLFFGAMVSHAGEPLIIGVENKDWGGHYVWDNGKLSGIDADIVRAVAKRMGHEIVFEPYPWKRVMQMAELREIDAVLDLAPTELRKRFLYFVATPVSLESTVFWVRKGSTFSFDGTLNRTIRLGLMAGSDWSDRFVRHGTPNVVRFNGYEAALRNLVAGRIDALGGHLAPTWEEVKRHGFVGKVEPSQPVLDNLPYYLAFTHRPGHRELAVRFADALQKFFRSSDYRKLLRKHDVRDAENPVNYLSPNL